jgi:hypothetical protein
MTGKDVRSDFAEVDWEAGAVDPQPMFVVERGSVQYRCVVIAATRPYSAWILSIRNVASASIDRPAADIADLSVARDRRRSCRQAVRRTINGHGYRERVRWQVKFEAALSMSASQHAERSGQEPSVSVQLAFY